MSYTLSFGQYEGQTFEWIFFNAPWYAEFIYTRRIHRQEHNMDEEEGAYFLELYRRAWSLTGTCSQCNERPVQRMGLGWQAGGLLGLIGYYCDECECEGGSHVEYQAPAFFTEHQVIPRRDQKRIVREIKRLWFGGGRMTQERMKSFFRNDANFTHATPGFFDRVEVPG